MDILSSNLINDVMSSDDDPCSIKSVVNSETDSAIESHELHFSQSAENGFLASGLSKIYPPHPDSLKMAKRPWQDSSSLMLKPAPNASNSTRPPGTLETANELTQKTSELQNLQASYDNMSYRFDMINTDQSTLRSQISSKDRQIKQLQQKIYSLESNVNRTNGDYEQIRKELERSRLQQDEAKEKNDKINENLSSEVRQREEVIEQLRTELTQTARTIHRPIENENAFKEKCALLEKNLTQKDQQIQSMQRQNMELENTVKALHEENQKLHGTGSTIEDLEQEIEFMKEQLRNANKKNDALNEALTDSKTFYDDCKNTSDSIMKDNLISIEKLKKEYKDLDRNHKECLVTIKQQGDTNTRLLKEVKDLTDKIKTGDHQQVEQDKRIRALQLENTDIKQKIENLKLQLSKTSTSETNLNHSIRNENDSRQGHIEQLSQENITLNRATSDLKDKMKIRDSTIEKLNEQLVESNNIRNKDMKTIKSLEEKICMSSHEEKILQNELKEKTYQIDAVTLELKEVKNQYDRISEEFRKITSDKRDVDRSLKRKDEVHIQEVSEKDSQLDSAKSEITKLNIMLTNEKDANQRLVLENERYLKEISGLTSKISECSDNVSDHQLSLDQALEREKRLQQHNKFLEGELEQLKLALMDSNQELDQLKNSWKYREDSFESCRSETKKHQENNLSLIQKIEQRDELLQRLSAEASKLKQKYQDKQAENLKISKSYDGLKVVAGEVEKSLKDFQQKYENMMRKKDSTIEQMKAELSDSKNQYSQCYEALLKKEEYLTRTQATEKEQAFKLNEAQKEISRLQSDYDEMEGELNIARAKHRACQEELGHHDEQLAELKNELQLQQQDNFELQSERLVCQQELDRWRDKYLEYKNQFESQVNETGILENNLKEKDNFCDELLGRLQSANQKCENYEGIIEELKIELGLAKTTGSDRSSHFQMIITSLKGENENKQQENKLLEERFVNFKSQNSKLKAEQEKSQQTIMSLKNELEIATENVKIKEMECQHWIQQTQSAQYLNEEVKVSLISLEKEINFIKQQSDGKDAKLQANAEVIVKLKNERNQNYKGLVDCKGQMDSVAKERDDLGRCFEESNNKIRQYEQCIKDLNEELTTVHIDMTDYSNRITKLETELSHSNIVNENKQTMIGDLERKIAKIKTNFNNYKTQYKTTECEVENLNGLLLQQTKRSSDLEISLAKLTSDRDKLIHEKEVHENKILQLKEIIDYKTKESERLNIERNEKSKLLEDKLIKYQNEIRKLRTYGKQVDEHVLVSRKAIENIQNELDHTQEQLDLVTKKHQSSEGLLERKDREVYQLEQKLFEIEKELNIYHTCKEADSEKLSRSYKEIEVLQSELKEKNSKILEVTTEYTKYQVRCGGLEDQLDVAEKKLIRSEAECSTLRTSFSGYNKEIVQLRSQQQNQADVLDKSKSQYERFAVEYNILKEETKKEKKNNLLLINELEDSKNKLQARIDHQKLLERHIVEHETLISELQNEIVQQRRLNDQFQRSEFQKTQAMHHIESETENLSQTISVLESKLSEQERLATARQQEIINLNKKIRQYTESLIDKENKLKILEKCLHGTENEVNILRDHVTKIDMKSISSEMSPYRTDNVQQLQISLDSSQIQNDNLRAQMREILKDNGQLAMNCQTKEEDYQRIKKEKENLQARYADLTTNKQAEGLKINLKVQDLEEENECLHRTIKKLKTEIKGKAQPPLDGMGESVTKMVSTMNQDDQVKYEKIIRELKEELEYQSDQMKNLKSKFENLYSDKSGLLAELSYSKDTISKLKLEKESIVDNFNAWVQEQRLANEKLGDKIRDQHKMIQELKKERSQFEREKDRLIKQLEICQTENMTSRMGEMEFFKQQLLTAERQFDNNLKSNDGCPSNTKMLRGYESDDSLDKQYWIKRVGELSEELEQCKVYWSNKVKEISNNIDSSTVSDVSLSPKS